MTDRVHISEFSDSEHGLRRKLCRNFEGNRAIVVCLLASVRPESLGTAGAARATRLISSPLTRRSRGGINANVVW